MKAISKKAKWIFIPLLGLTLGIAGCNLFNPTGESSIDSDDSQALTYEGYLKIQNGEFSEAKKLFRKAIKADSSNSEAWFGMAKAVMNCEDDLNTFHLIQIASEIDSLEESKIDSIRTSIDSVLFYLDKLIDREEAGKTDNKIKLEQYAAGYSILQLTKTALQLQKVAANVTELFDVSQNGMTLDLKNFSIDSLGDDFKPILQGLDLAATAMLENPEATSLVIKSYVPDSTNKYFEDDQYSDLVTYAANTIIDINTKLDTTENDRLSVFFSFANMIDDDGDGCVDEEILDGFDNDGDGEIDEDVRDTRSIVQETNPNSDVSVGTVLSLNYPEVYGIVDIDVNGKKLRDDPDEWEFELSDPKERIKQNNHLLKFAVNLEFNGEDLKNKIKNKELIRKDTDINHIKYNLEMRKQMVGGCWVNYSQKDFLKWFEGRSSK